jgi:hypothetical protein
MSAVVVEFQDVGRAKKSWTATLQRFTHSALYREVKRQNALGSTGIDFDYNEDEKRGLIVVGGFRVVGSFTVSDLAP